MAARAALRWSIKKWHFPSAFHQDFERDIARIRRKAHISRGESADRITRGRYRDILQEVLIAISGITTPVKTEINGGVI